LALDDVERRVDGGGQVDLLVRLLDVADVPAPYDVSDAVAIRPPGEDPAEQVVATGHVLDLLRLLGQDLDRVLRVLLDLGRLSARELGHVDLRALQLERTAGIQLALALRGRGARRRRQERRSGTNCITPTGHCSLL